MSEETQDHNDGTLSGLKKTLIGVATTAITAGGVWLTTLLSGGGEEAPAAPAPAAPVINITNSNQQAAPAAGKTVIIREKSTEAAVPTAVKKPKKDEHLDEEPKW